MKTWRKLLATGAAAAMLLTGCSSGTDSGSSSGGDSGSADGSKGSVYYLNFKPEQDEAWQNLAKKYTEETGVDVKVVTAASGNYETTLMS